MINNKKISVLIPARGGSKGLKKKNLQTVSGFSLIEITVLQAKIIFGNDVKIYVSTEDEEILNHCNNICHVIDRPIRLATDEASTISVIHHSLSIIKTKYICLMQCTNILRNCQKIKNQLHNFFKSDYNCTLSGYFFDGFFYEINPVRPVNRTYHTRPRRQDKKDIFLEDGSFYLFKTEKIKNENDFVFEIPFPIENFCFRDIHTIEDLEFIRKIWSKDLYL